MTERLAEGTLALAGNAPSSSAAVKEERLLERLASLDSLIIAFSGGADSAYLAWAATKVLGRQALCVTADSPSYPDRHRQLALGLSRDFGFRHELIQTSELDRPEYRANPTNRCYFCKHTLVFVALADGGPNAGSRRSPMEAMPTIAATTGPGVTPRGSSACSARSTRWG